MKIIVLIPAYNEEHSIGSLIRHIRKNKNIAQCVVVNDCSTDNTGIIAKQAGAHVLRRRQNGGTGESLRIGLQYVAKQNTDLVLLMDADGQHDPKYLHALIQTTVAGADYVIASRYLRPGEHVTVFSRRLGTKLIAGMIRLLYGKVVSDPTSGFRAMNKRTIHYFVNHFPVIFNEPEAAIELIERGFVIKEIPCRMKPRIYGTSSITSGRTLYLMIYILTKMISRRMF